VTTSSAQILANLVFELSHLYAIAADFRTRASFSNQDIQF
jgi:hypothetical protein